MAYGRRGRYVRVRVDLDQQRLEVLVDHEVESEYLREGVKVSPVIQW